MLLSIFSSCGTLRRRLLIIEVDAGSGARMTDMDYHDEDFLPSEEEMDEIWDFLIE